MIGLALSVFLGLVLLAFGRQWQDVYNKSTTLLFWWNMAVTLSLISVWVSGTVFIAGLGGLVSGGIGFLVGLTGGGIAVSVLMFFMVAMSVVQTLGVLFMNNAIVVDSSGGYQWKPVTFSVGVTFFVVGLSRIFG